MVEPGPLSCLAAILLVAGVKLASPALVKQMWDQGRSQFAPFAVTVVAIVLTDLLIGILIGLAVSIGFILESNMRRPLRRVVQRHLGGEVVHIELANQVSFLNRAILARAFDEVSSGGHILIDAHNTDYIDPDVLDLIRDFGDSRGPARGVQVSLLGFRRRYQIGDRTRYLDHSTRELQSTLAPEQVLQILKDGHDRFRTGRHLTRDPGRLVSPSADGQYPLAVVLGCADSRVPAEILFDTGPGDIFSVRIAGNVASREVLGSLEYGCAVAGAKLIVVLGHTQCGAVTAAVERPGPPDTVGDAEGCRHLESIVQDIRRSIDPQSCRGFEGLSEAGRRALVDAVARRNVARGVEVILHQSQTVRRLADEGRVAVIGAMYDVASCGLEFLPPEAAGAGRALAEV